MSSKVLKHPDKEEIISKLLNGESLKDVERWLSKKYPRKIWCGQKIQRISSKDLAVGQKIQSYPRKI